MNLDSLLSPLLRRPRMIVGLFVLFAGFILGIEHFIPPVQKTTLYFTVKPLEATHPSLDTIESASKVSEMIAGWVKDPGFREKIAAQAEVQIPNFKRKITARKQNRLNVFVTLKLNQPNWKHSDKIIQALLHQIENNFSTWAQQNGFPSDITEARISQEIKTFPLSWLIISMVLIAGIGSVGSVYLYETLSGTIAFPDQLEALFPEAPQLSIAEPVGKHDSKLLEQFILTFPSPRLIGTFQDAKKKFALAPIDAVDEEVDTPVLLIKLGETKLRDLKNLGAIFGDEIGLIVFER